MFSESVSQPCWETENTQCSHQGLELLVKLKGDKGKNVCKQCLYFKKSFPD